MKLVHGKPVFESLEEVVNPAHTAVLVIDMQNDLVSFEGLGARRGGNPVAQHAIIPALQRLLGAAREAGVCVIYIKVVTEQNYASMHPSWLYRYRVLSWTNQSLDERFLEDTWGADIVEELTPQSGDLIVKKHRESAFIGTELDQVLRSNGIQSVVVVGTATGGCVQSTTQDAQWLDYYTVVAQDCVPSGEKSRRNEIGLALMGEACDTPTSEELIAAWRETGSSD
mgnify:FL=1